MLDLYSDYLICQNKKATATGLSDLLGDDVSHDQVTRFLNRDLKNGKDLWKYIKIEVYHKSIKQNSSLAKSPTKRVKSQSNHIFASVGYL